MGHVEGIPLDWHYRLLPGRAVCEAKSSCLSRKSFWKTEQCQMVSGNTPGGEEYNQALFGGKTSTSFGCYPPPQNIPLMERLLGLFLSPTRHAKKP